MAAIEVRNVRKAFGTHVALRDVSLRVEAGSIFGFLGPNGAGKTTTLRGLVGLIRFDGGAASVLGLDPWNDRVEVHARLGYLPSGMGMYPHLTGRQMLDHAAALAVGPGAASPLRAAALDALQLGDDDLARPVADYSKGMRQKVAMVQALQHDPDLLLMDEPSEGLDPLVQHAVYELLRERAAAGRTILFSSHTLGEVEALCDHVAIIREGELVVQAPLEELRAQRPRIVRVVAEDPAQLASLGPTFVREDDDHAGRAVFSVAAPPDEIVAALAGLHLRDVIIDEPSLDSIFRSFYDGTASPSRAGGAA